MLERRACRRFVILGATVVVQVRGLLESQKPVPDDVYPVVDLSKGGICFFSDRAPKEDKEVTLLLNFSEHGGPLLLEGKVIYISVNKGISYQYRVGVQFKPFGNRDGYNPVDRLTKLEELEKTYGAGRKQ